MPEEGLDLLATYNYYRTSEKDCVTGYIMSPPTVSAIKAPLKYGIDEAVIEVGDSFKVTSPLDLRLHLGVQYTRINESQGFGRLDPPSFTYYGNYEYETEFQGYGLRLGIDCNYGLGKGFSLTGGISGGCLVGRTKVHEAVIYPTTDSTSFHYDDAVPICNADIGLVYDIKMSKTALLNISLGYEFNEYFNVAGSTNYVLHGPYFKARLDL